MSKHSTKLVILTLLVSLIALSGCGKLSQNSTIYYKISQTMKDYCYFDKGSFWIYQNDSTGVTDSVIVTDINSYIAFHPLDASGNAYSYNVIEATYNNNPYIKLTGLYAGEPGVNGKSGMYRIFYTKDTFALALAPGFKIGEPQLLGGQEGVYTNIDSAVSLSINGLNFNNVYHTREKVSLQNGDTTQTDFYFAPHYGLVKWIISHQGKTLSYSLKSSQLIQK